MATKNVQGSETSHPLGGMSNEQIALLCERIATDADTLSAFSAYAAQRAEGASIYDFHVVDSLAEKIGALAEMMVPGTARENVVGWLVGTHFPDEPRPHCLSIAPAVRDATETVDSSDERTQVGWAAACQIDALLGMLAREEGQDDFDLTARAAMVRMRQLSSITLSVFGGDTGRKLSEMKAVLNG
ncbi:hypothetical protein [Variovorax boronicumulans]|uniref:hypothetical protein n=1 Tax=Variovorax boronicumulans TaxID=436515 RepID=UPI0012F7B2F0|nr:hypothetical protein [Variovorax boronicumulans]